MRRRLSIWSYCTSLIWVITLLLLPLLSFGHAEIQDFTNCLPSQGRRLASEFVSAFTSRLEAGKSCETNVTSSSQQDVHVIVVNLQDYADDDEIRAIVNLDVLSRRHGNLQNPPGMDYQESHRPMVFVLLSSIRVRWKVTLEGVAVSGKHLFMISRDCSIRLRRRRYRPLVKSRKRDLPMWSDYQAIQRWTQRRFGGVTSFNEIYAPTVKFYTGRDANTDSQCQVTTLTPSHRIFSSHQESEPITGCVAMSRKRRTFNKSVYILELMEVPKPTPEMPDISLEILLDDSYMPAMDDEYGLRMRDGSVSDSNDPRFFLVVKSPVDLKWSLHSSKLSGWIDIVTDADINLDDLKLSTIALRREELSQSGEDLVKWSQEILADVQMYAGIKSANVVKLKIPPRVMRSTPSPNEEDHSQDQPGITERDGDWTTSDPGFEKMITTECTSDHMEVAIAKTFIEATQVDKTKISLRDSNCRMSRETEDHIILRTGLNECGTHSLEIDNIHSYSNKVLLWTTPSLAHNLLQDLGSGNFDGETGSGARDASPFMDDEDFQTKRLALDVECNIKEPEEGKDDNSNNDVLTHCNLTLYSNYFFLRPHIKFPMTVTKGSYIYVKAAVTNKDVSLIADSCWVSSSHLPHHRVSWKQIILHGCETTSTLQWLDDPMDAPVGTDLKTTKFGFQLGDEFLGKSLIYLHCQFRTCHRDNYESASKCSIESEKRCELMKQKSQDHASDSSHADCGPLTMGPLELTDKVVHVNRPGTNEESATKENDSKGRQQQHQRVIIEGLDSPTVVGIAFAAFIIGIFLVGALWFIHSHTGEAAQCCPIKTAVTSQTNVNASGDLTPNSSSPMTA